MSLSLKGKTICITGKIDGFTRDEFPAIAREYGFRLVKTVNKQVDILVVGERAGKVKKDAAVKLRIREMSAKDFLHLLSLDQAAGIVPEHVMDEETKEKRRRHYENDEMAGMF